MTTRKTKSAPVANDLQAMIAQAVAQAMQANTTQLVATKSEPEVITKAETDNEALNTLQAVILPVIEAEKTFAKVVTNTSAALVDWAHGHLSRGVTALTLRGAIDNMAKYVDENAIKNSTLKVYLSQLRLVVTNADAKIEGAKVRDLLIGKTSKGEPKPASLKRLYDKTNAAKKAGGKPLTAAQVAAERAEKIAAGFRVLASSTMRDNGLMTENKKGFKVESVSFAPNAFIITAEALINSLLDTLAVEAEKHALKAQAKRLEAIKSELHDVIAE